jgi:ElaB/YqjD/DUF883 family membrane-anchored ribosome-binding protein
MAQPRARQAHKSVADAASGLQDLIESAEELLENIRDEQGAAVDRLRDKISASVSNARDRLADMDVPEVASQAYDSTIGFLRRDPWRAVAICALAVLATSLLMRGSSDD